MAKTEEELMEIKKKVEDLKTELDSLSDEELDKVAGGVYKDCSTPDKRLLNPDCMSG